MTVTISGNGTFTGTSLNANNIAANTITANNLSSSLDLSAKTLSLPGNTRTTTTETIDNSKEVVDNPTTGGVFEQRRILRVATSGEELLQQKLVYSFRQSTTDYWIKILTPQAYAAGEAGGTATFKVSYLTVHAAGSAFKTWRAAFGNNHGREFAWAPSAVETLKVSDSYYGWTPTLTHWRNSGSSDSAMREYYLKFSNYPGGYAYIDIVLEIEGTTGSGTWPYAITDLGNSAPSPISQLTVTG